MSSGANDPASTTSSTSTTEVLVALHRGMLKFLALALKTKFPARSAFHPFTKAKSAVTACSRRLLLTTVKSFTRVLSSARIRLSGIPQSSKPPTMILAPPAMSLRAPRDQCRTWRAPGRCWRSRTCRRSPAWALSGWQGPGAQAPMPGAAGPPSSALLRLWAWRGQAGTGGSCACSAALHNCLPTPSQAPGLSIPGRMAGGTRSRYTVAPKQGPPSGKDWGPISFPLHHHPPSHLRCSGPLAPNPPPPQRFPHLCPQHSLAWNISMDHYQDPSPKRP